MKLYHDREHAGRQLGRELAESRLGGDVIVLGLPRGGVPVAAEVAKALAAPLDVLVVRKLGAPYNPELAVGAIAYGGITVYNDDLLAALGLDESDLEPLRAHELRELERRETAYRGRKPPPDVTGKTVIIVDDGIATGATTYAAVLATRALRPAEIVVAAPTSALDSVERLQAVADRVIVGATPEPYFGVGAWYEDFPQLSDAEVVDCLARYAVPARPAGQPIGEP
jgi:predicted phosphoribosyltransferase